MQESPWRPQVTVNPTGENIAFANRKKPWWRDNVHKNGGAKQKWALFRLYHNVAGCVEGVWPPTAPLDGAYFERASCFTLPLCARESAPSKAVTFDRYMMTSPRVEKPPNDAGSAFLIDHKYLYSG